MRPAPGTYPIGPATGGLVLHTSREGVAARVGHDLTVTFERWSGSVSVAPGGDIHVEATIDAASFRVLRGSGGIAPVTDRDRREIAKTARALLRAGAHPHATFRSTATTPVPRGSGESLSGTIEGVLSVAGSRAAIRLDVIAEGAAAWRATGCVRQSELGITPYRAMLGALRLADEVRIEVDVKLPNDPTS